MLQLINAIHAIPPHLPQENGPHDGGVIFSTKNGRFVHLVFFLCVPMFLLYLVKIAFNQSFSPAKCMRRRYLQFRVFYVILQYAYIGIYRLHRYLHETPPRGTALFFLLVSPLLINCCFAL